MVIDDDGGDDGDVGDGGGKSDKSGGGDMKSSLADKKTESKGALARSMRPYYQSSDIGWQGR